MDRDALIAVLSNNARFNSKFPYERKAIAEHFVELILDAIASEGREPDEWEAHNIAAAIGYIAGSMYNAALVVGERALTPAEERSPVPAKHLADPPAGRHLRDALAKVEEIPAQSVISAIGNDRGST